MSEKYFQRIYLSGFLILFASLLYYQIIEGDFFLKRAKNNYVRVVPSLALRGTIFDRNKRPIAYDVAAYNLAVIPYQIKKNKDQIFSYVAQTLGRDPEILQKSYKRNFLNYFSPVNILSDVTNEEAIRAKNALPNYVLINPQPQRYYPYPELYAHVLGYVKEVESFLEQLKQYGYTHLERAGLSGIEQYYDAYLKGENGGDLIEVGANGTIVGFLGERRAEKGKDITLTIDTYLQETAYSLLDSHKGTVIFMQAKTGQILTLASSPTYNSNNFIHGQNVKQYFNNKDSPLINRAIQSRYPLGSTFKPLLALAALEEGTINENTTFFCNGVIHIANRDFHCAGVHHKQTLVDALAHSCNIFFYETGYSLGVEAIAQWTKNFGLDHITNIDLPYEKSGIVPTPQWKQKNLKQSWFGGDTINLSIGQGYIEATPLEVITAINVIASNGYLVRPYLLAKIEDKSMPIFNHRYISFQPKHIKLVRAGMRDAVRRPSGTAHILKGLGLDIAGKTGTAQTQGTPHGWFVGFFPADNPKYSICVFLENAGSSAKAVHLTYEFLKKIKGTLRQ